MNNLDIDPQIEELQQRGIFSLAERQDINNITKSQNIVEYTLLCNKICFSNYRQQMTIQQSECHDKCFDNMLKTLQYCQRRFWEQNSKNHQF